MEENVLLPPCYLAPMAEFTAPPMRVMCERYGAQRTYTEMVNAEGICRQSPKTLFLLETFPEEKHVWAHLYGPDPSRLAEAAQHVEAMGLFEGIDINAGCPVPRITAQGAGSALLKDLPRLGQILTAIRKAVKLPISLKTRLGPNPQVSTWKETLKRAEDAGINAITFHARYTSQGHAGTVHYDTLAEIVQSTALPIYGNGSIINKTSAEKMASTGVKALLIARAAMENPAIFDFKPIQAYTFACEHLELEKRYRKIAEKFSRLSADKATVLTFRKHIFRYFKGLPGANTLRGNLMNFHSCKEIYDAIEKFTHI